MKSVAPAVAGRLKQHTSRDAATVGIPRELRHDTLKQFAETVAPQFSSKFRGATAAQ